MFIKIIPPKSISVGRKELMGIFALLFQGKLIKGDCVERFEQRFAEYIGVKFAVAVPSGRVGLRLILESLGLKEGEEIITPAYTFYAIPEQITKAGFKPEFVDINEKDCNINANLIEDKITTRTKAIIATHIFGSPCDLDAILKIAKKHGLFVIEDCAQAIGAEYGRRKVGSFGDCAYFSFESVKPFHTFGGGMVITDKDLLHKRLKNKAREIRYPSYIQAGKKIFFTVTESILTKPDLFGILVYPFLGFFMFLGKDLLALSKRAKNKFKLLETRYANFQACSGLIKLGMLDKQIEGVIENARYLIRILDKDQKEINDSIKPIFYYFVIRADNRSNFYNALFRKGIIGVTDIAQNCALNGEKGFPVAERMHNSLVQIHINGRLNKRNLEYMASVIKENKNT